MTKKVKIISGVLGVILLASLCPVFTSVSGTTKITILREDDQPMVGMEVRQWWSVYGWGGIRGTAKATTDSTGSVVFPHRTTISFLGPRLFNRTGAFITQCSMLLAFGHFGSGYIERWGPIVGIDVDLPSGYWQPAAWKPASSDNGDIVTAHISGGPHRYIYVQNIDPLHPNAYISGDAQGFIGETEVILRLREATPEEKVFIRNNRSRQDMIEYQQRSKLTRPIDQ